MVLNTGNYIFIKVEIMALPKLQSVTFELEIPSTKEKITYRPFTVKEEKILLIAQRSDESKDQINAVKQIITNCIIIPELYDVNKLASFDIEYLFLKLRAKSVGETVEIEITPRNREGMPGQKIEINIDQIEPTFTESHTDTMDLGSGVRVKMKYPTFEVIAKFSDSDDEESALEIFGECIKTIYQDEESYEASDYSKAELDEFVESMSAQQAQILQRFFETLPKIAYNTKYEWTNPDDLNDTYEEDIEITGLISFLS